MHESRVEAISRLTTGLWPGFPSDMVSLVTVLATQAEGETLIHDWMYELRLFALEQLSAACAPICSSATRTASSCRGRPSCAAAPSTAATCGRAWPSSPRRWRPRAAARSGRSRPSSAATRTSSSACKSLGAAVEVRAELGRGTGRRVTAAAASVGGVVGGIAGGRVVGWLVGGWIWPGGPTGVEPGRKMPPGAASSSCGGGGRRLRLLRGQRQLVDAAARVAADAERAQVVYVEVEHADDPRRQHQHDVGLLASPSCCAEQPADDREVAQSRRSPSSVVRSSSRIRPASMFVSPSRSRIVVSM